MPAQAEEADQNPVRTPIRVASVFEAPLTIGVVFTGDVKWSFLTAVVVTGRLTTRLMGWHCRERLRLECLSPNSSAGKPKLALQPFPRPGLKQSPGVGHDRARPPWPRTTGIYLYLSGKATSRVASVFEAPLTIGVVFTGDSGASSQL